MSQRRSCFTSKCVRTKKTILRQVKGLHQFKNCHRQLTIKESPSLLNQSCRKVILCITSLMQTKLACIGTSYPIKPLLMVRRRLRIILKLLIDRAPLMATANASGDFRLPLFFINKSAKPQCFSGMNVSALPLHF